MAPSRLAVVAVLLLAATRAVAHGDEHSGMSDMDMNMNTTSPATSQDALYSLPGYAGLEQHSSMMLAHILFMTVAWFFVLPVGVMFSIGRSKLALPVQFFFLTLNGVGVVLGTVYNISTPDLYVRNAHHSIGWIATWIMTAQVVMSLLFVYAGRTKQELTTFDERAAFLPASLHGVDRLEERPYAEYRWSRDSGQGTEPNSPRNQSCDFLTPASPEQQYTKPEENCSDADQDEDEEDIPLTQPRRPHLLHNSLLDKYLSSRIPQMFSSKIHKSMEIAYEIIDRTILILGFIALTTGGVTYVGVFRGRHVFNGLAHFIKGGIFLWYGLFTLGRWMGSFADLGWAWNVKPTRSEVGQWKSSAPSAEFIESFLIFFYGASNVFLEHLAAWGEAWSAQDFEHVSISVMFFGGGLCGMLIESKTIRTWLNTSVDVMPTRLEVHPSEASEIRTAPRSYNFPMNPVPGLIILLLGIMMSSHHQDSMVSTMVHKQWGTLLCGGALVRALTYIITYISPPTSIYPSRPPTEVITAFCLISGGILFMASTKDVIHYMEEYNLMAMFIFTVTMGFTAFLMAYEILVIALKGWAVRRENKKTLR